jgi:hypothetical protein
VRRERVGGKEKREGRGGKNKVDEFTGDYM